MAKTSDAGPGADAEAKEAAAARARSDAETLAGPIATLRSAGQAVITHQHNDDTDSPIAATTGETAPGLWTRFNAP